MPIYTFRCKCGYEIDKKMLSTDEKVLPRCPACLGLRKMEQVLYCPPVKFYGLGFSRSWHERDYERTYGAPPVTAPPEHQDNWEEANEKNDRRLGELAREMWERKVRQAKLKWNARLFYFLHSKIKRV